MKQYTFISSLFSLIYFIGFSQTPQIQQSSDKAQGVFEQQRTSQIPTFSPSLYVNPFIGTGGAGHTFPGATAPFGMIQLSPDTHFHGWEGCSGYHYEDSIIYGFSHTHLSGTGIEDYCDLLLVPQLGKPKIQPGYLTEKGYGQRFKHENEKATPGFYAVQFPESGIDVELIAGERSGFHVYRFKNKGRRTLLIDLDHRDKVLEADWTVHGKNQITGKRISSSWSKNQHFYFCLETSVPFSKVRTFKQNGQHKLLLHFPKKTSEIIVKVGMSFTNEAEATRNLEAEIPHWNPAQLRAETTKKWNKELSKIMVSTENPDQLTTFYTALYHTMIAPNVFSDVSGTYRGMDGKIQQLPADDKQYSVFSLWDTYRALHPLFALIDHERTNQFVRTFLRQFEQSGDLPVWELAAQETDCMIGYHSVSVIADAYNKNIRDFDEKKALQAMVSTAKNKAHGKPTYRQLGFVNASEEPESVSKTLEYAYDDFCIAEMAKSMKVDSTAKEFEKSSFNFINVFDPSTKFMRARRGGSWFSPFDPTEVNFNYTEANSWQYSFYVPHYPEHFAQLLGGKDSLEAKLDALFKNQKGLTGRNQADITGLIGQYAHGNEPSHHIAYLYNYTNNPFKAQIYLDSIMRHFYRNAPDGLAGNEDCGQMSAWYVFSSLGFYPMSPGKPEYELGRPMFQAATIYLENGKTIQMKAPKNNAKNKFVKSVKWNGVALNNTLSHLDMMKGGTLEFEMGEEPLVIANSENSSQNFEIQWPEKWTPAPYVVNEERVFEDRMKLGLDVIRLDTNDLQFIFYQLDSLSDWQTYERPIIINKTTDLQFRAQRRTPKGSIGNGPIIQALLSKGNKELTLQLHTPFENQYAASGENALIDGVRGGIDYRTGDWQGFWDKDVQATVTFDTPKKMQAFGISLLQDQAAWIFFPHSWTVEISENGTDFREIGSQSIANPAINTEVRERKEIWMDLKTEKSIQAIRFTLKHVEKLPNWHLNPGQPSWIFADEVLIK
jgi:predicted alpha-1,2-mannosidase